VSGEQRACKKPARAPADRADGSSSLVARLLHGPERLPDNRIIAVRAYYEDVRGPARPVRPVFFERQLPRLLLAVPHQRNQRQCGRGHAGQDPAARTSTCALLRPAEEDPAFSQRIGRGRRLGKISGWPLTTYDPLRRSPPNGSSWRRRGRAD